MENSEAVKSASNHRNRSTVGPVFGHENFILPISTHSSSFFLHSPALAAAILHYTLLPLQKKKFTIVKHPSPRKGKSAQKKSFWWML
jgi:hypothetical protein